MRATCIDNKKGTYNLTVGSSYKVTEDNGFFWVKNSIGKKRKYSKKYFKTDEEIKIPEKVIPPPPPPDLFTEKELIDSIEILVDKVQFVLENEEYFRAIPNFNQGNKNIVNGNIFKIDLDILKNAIGNIKMLIGQVSSIYPFVKKYENNLISVIIKKLLEEQIRISAYLILEVSVSNDQLDLVLEELKPLQKIELTNLKTINDSMLFIYTN